MTAKSNGSSPLALIPEDFLDDLGVFICARLDRMGAGRESERYGEWAELIGRLHERLEGMLTEEGREMLEELEEAYGMITGMEMERAYGRGLGDGVGMREGVGHES